MGATAPKAAATLKLIRGLTDCDRSDVSNVDWEHGGRSVQQGTRKKLNDRLHNLMTDRQTDGTPWRSHTLRWHNDANYLASAIAANICEYFVIDFMSTSRYTAYLYVPITNSTLSTPRPLRGEAVEHNR